MRNLTNEELVVELQKDFPAYEFKLCNTGHPDWARIFIKGPGGFQVGRLSIQEPPYSRGGLKYWLKHYKKWFMDYETGDEFFYQFDNWIETGEIVEINDLIEDAKVKDQERFEEVMRNREELDKDLDTPKKRKAVVRNWSNKFKGLVRDRMNTRLEEWKVSNG